MKVKPIVTIPTTANLAIIVFCLVGIIVSPCKATRDMSAIIHDAENKNHQSGLGANGQLQISIGKKKIARKLDSPSCVDSPLQILRGKNKRSAKTCQVIAKKKRKYCTTTAIKSHCPNACDACDRYGSADSEGTFIFEGAKRDCKWNRKLLATPSTLIQISDWCQEDGIRDTCRKTCSAFCASDVTSSPSAEPTSFPSDLTSSPSVEPTSSPMSAPSAVPSPQVPTVIPCAEKVKSVIESKFGDVIDGSPQGYGLDWLIEDIDDDDCNDQDKMIQRFVLAAFYFSTGGDHWLRKYGWLRGGDECAWEGLFCTRKKALMRISLGGNNLNGTIVDEIHALESLMSFDINSNEAVSGTIPQSIGRLERLYYLGLSNNALTGPIPDLSGLINLEQLYAYSNDLTGQIPQSIGRLEKLYDLKLSNNALTGPIPDLSGLINLQELHASNNDLTGQIPQSIGRLEKLYYLEISNNALTGPIPDLSGLINLQKLYASNNDLTGPITDQFEGVTKLTNMDLSSNALTGTVPDMTGLATLYSLNLDSNYLTGQITDQFEGMAKLMALSLGQNALTGNIPDLSTNTDLYYFYVSGNDLDGGLDASLFQLPIIMYLFLDDNKLTGPIPDNFGGSTNLVTLHLHDNFLTGSIPDISGDSLQSIEYLSLYKNKMSDPVPDSLCTLRSNKGDQFKDLRADCAPHGNAQNECPSDCCTECFVGKGLP